MLNLYICEDDLKQLKRICKLIQDQIVYKNLDMNIEMTTQNPDDILSNLKTRMDSEHGVYFLDVDLNSDINGIELGSKIREYDPRAYIVYITIHPELMSLTFKHKVEALDYICKTDKDLKNRVSECLKNINEKHINDIKAKSKGIFIKTEQKSIGINFDDILYIETAAQPHKIVMHTYNKRIEFYGRIAKIQSQLDERFILAHRSRIINTEKIVSIDKKNRAVSFDNGQTTYVSVRAMSNVLNSINYSRLKQ